MNVRLRAGRPGDAAACGRICYEAFGAIANAHGYPHEFPSAEVATAVLSGRLTDAGFYSVVAEVGGKIVGSNFLDERSPIAGVGQGTCLVAEHDGRISGYSAGPGYFGHSIGETNEDLKALIAAVPAFAGPGILVPATNTGLFEWCLHHGLRIIQLMTIMTIGLYSQPAGSYLPSVLY